MSVSARLANDAYKLALDYSPHPAGSELPPVLAAAKRNTVSFQLILQADRPYAVNVGKEPWFSEKGPLLCLRTEVTAPCPCEQNIEDLVRDDDGIRKADILLRQDVAESAPHMPTAVWINLFVPPDMPAGPFEATVRVYASSLYRDERLEKTLTVTVDVRDFVMPGSREYSFWLDLWQHSGNIARKHDVKLWSDAHFAVLEHYIRSLAELGQKSATVTVSEAPWRGQSCFLNHRNPSNLFEYSMIPITREKDGRFVCDYRILQRYIDLCLKYGIGGEIEVFGLVNIWNQAGFDDGPVCAEYPENILLRYYDKADGHYRYKRRAEDIERYIAGLEQYFIASGQIDRVRIAADEPADEDRYRKSLQRIRGIAPHFHYKTAINHAEFIREFQNEISDFAPFVSCLCNEYGTLTDYRAHMPDKRFLWYVCCGPDHLNTFIRSHLLESRFIGIFTSFAGLDGFLRWNYTVWPDDPRSDIRYGSFPAGDTNFVYPSRDGSVLLSLRYWQLKKGIEDFELLTRLKKAGCPDTVRRVYDRLIKEKDLSAYFTPDLLPMEQIASLQYSDYNEARGWMLDALQKAGPGGGAA